MRSLYCLILIFQISALLAQEGVRALSANPGIRHRNEKPFYPAAQTNEKNTLSTNPIQLPFLDDFYYSTLSIYPEPNKWKDSMVYINSGFPIAPPSIGVATFDGLNTNGYPYEPNYANLSESHPADTLTSQDINLFQSGSQVLLPSDSIGFSFYYQARGNGEAPEVGDSLLLDFFKPKSGNKDSVWISNVWYAKGNSNPNLNDTVFKRVFIWVKDTEYLKENFRFRFRNKATTSGNFDHWHLDYVYLNKNRSMLADTVYNDLTFGNVPSSFLLNYAAMPYQQFSPGDMAIRNSVRIKNNGPVAINMSYENQFYDAQHTLLHNYNGGASNLDPFKPKGYSTYAPHARPTFGYTFTTMSDSTDFMIKHFLYRSQGVSPDFILANDTIYQWQRFHNYYAYDDGTAEGGYYVNGAGAKIALRFTLNHADTLRAVRIYFDPAGGLGTSEQLSHFRLCIWANNNGIPGALIYRDSSQLARFYDTLFKPVPEYKFSRPLALGGDTYFIGIQQEISTGIVIGHDRNNDYHQHLYYNLGTSWAQSQIKGSLMFRPILGKYIPPPASVHEDLSEHTAIFLVYPNPAQESIYLKYPNNSLRTVEIFNAQGQLVRNYKGKEQDLGFDLSGLPPGIYILSSREGTAPPQLRKIILQP